MGAAGFYSICLARYNSLNELILVWGFCLGCLVVLYVQQVVFVKIAVLVLSSRKKFYEHFLP